MEGRERVEVVVALALRAVAAALGGAVAHAELADVALGEAVAAAAAARRGVLARATACARGAGRDVIR